MEPAFYIALAVSVILAAALIFAVRKIFALRREVRRTRETDQMTGIYSRSGFMRDGQQLLDTAQSENTNAALIVFDIGELGRINTLFGTDAGDSLVVCFADSVKNTARDGDVYGRVNTDDFALLMSYDSEQEIDDVISEFREQVYGTLSGALKERVSFFAGVAVYDGCDDIYTLYNKANLCISMNDGAAPVTRFTDDMERIMTETEFLRSEMLTALEDGQFELYYQPKISFRTGIMTGVEALIRWHHPTKGFVSPAEFIPLAEKTGLITKIDEWGLRTACRQCKQWQDEGLPPVKISVNMSQAQFYRTDVCGTVSKVLEETGLDPKWLEIEVTETMAMQDIRRTVDILNSIREMGVSVSMDDFGSGYSSLSSLKTIPLDILKIDRSLVCDIESNDVSRQIACAIVNLGKAMKLVILAEGVENEQQRSYLSSIGCDLAQGYYYSKPRPASEIAAMLAKMAG